MATATAALAGYGCNGPISDWPPKADGNGGGAVGGAGPITGLPGGAGSPRPDAGAAGPGGTAAGATPGGAGATPGGATGTPGGGFPAGGLTGGGTAGGGTPGGQAGDAGVSVPPADGGSASMDAGTGAGDAGPDAGAIDAGADAGDAGWPSDGGCSFVPIDASIHASGVPGADAGVCAAYGCGVTLGTLGQIAKPGAPCAVPEALAVACNGQLARAAMICTQENALGLGLGRPVTTCLRRAPQFEDVPVSCVQCYADESLCTLSRCFVACIDGNDPACDQCRQQSCGAAFSSCSGLPQALR